MGAIVNVKFSWLVVVTCRHIPDLAEKSAVIDWHGREEWWYICHPIAICVVCMMDTSVKKETTFRWKHGIPMDMGEPQEQLASQLWEAWLLSRETQELFQIPLGSLVLNYQMSVQILQSQNTLCCFNCLSFVALVGDRSSFKDNKWLAIILLWKVLFCPGTL